MEQLVSEGAAIENEKKLNLDICNLYTRPPCKTGYFIIDILIICFHLRF